MAKPEKNVDLDFKTPVVLVDGSGVGLSQDKKGGNVVFFQIRSEDKENIKADVVAAARLNVEQLISLRDGLTNAIEEAKADKQPNSPDVKERK